MSAKKKHTESYQNPVLKDRLEEFNEKMKKHLSKEMMYLTEKRDDYENQILQLKIEKEQRIRPYSSMWSRRTSENIFRR